MTPTEQFLQNAERFSAVVEATSDWDAPSACAEWSAAEVVHHVVDTQRDYLRGHGATLADPPSPDPADVWRTHLDGVRRALADREFAALAFDGFVGPTTVEEMLAGFYGFDLTVHRWDLGRASDLDVGFTDQELSALEAQVDALGDMFYSSGASAPPLEVGPEASQQTRVLARMGRRG